VAVPVALTILATHEPSLALFSAFAGTAILWLDAAFLYPLQNSARVFGAQVHEMFECLVLDLPKSRTRLANAPDVDEIEGAARSGLKSDNGRKLRDWYPPQFAELPIALARLACMRASCTYDAGLRSAYLAALVAVAIAGLTILAVAALRVSASLETFIVLFVAPTSPVFVWAIREIVDQFAAKSDRVELRNAICDLWTDALDLRRSSEEIERATLDFHSALAYHHRNFPGVPAFIYALGRRGLEDRMRRGAVALVEEAHLSSYWVSLSQ